MIPELFRIGDFAISPFGPALVAAFLVAFFQLRWGLRERGYGDDEDASTILFWAGAGGIVGSKLYFAVLYHDWKLLFDRSGLVWYGGFFLAAVLVFWTIHRRKLPFWGTLDSATLGLALGYGVGRIGCFLVGDDYGNPTDLPWGVAFPEGLPPTPPGVHVHPTQIYETLMAVGIWWIGRRLFAKRLTPGVTGLAVIALLAVERFLVEFLRAKDDRFLGPFTVAQALSILILVLVALAYARRRGASQAEA